MLDANTTTCLTEDDPSESAGKRGKQMMDNPIDFIIERYDDPHTLPDDHPIMVMLNSRCRHRIPKIMILTPPRKHSVIEDIVMSAKEERSHNG
jgi:hypothetical protein